MSAEEVTVSLSRLALAKAIKTPDAGEEAEHWSKSVIFHQAHIDDQMRHSIQNPQLLQQQMRRTRQAKQNPQQRWVAPPMSRARSDEMHYKQAPVHSSQPNSYDPRLGKQQPQQQQQQQQPQQQHLPTVHPSKTNRRYVPSDDEEESEEESEEEEEEESEEDEEKEEQKPAMTSHEIKQSTPVPHKPLKVPITRTIEPSDDDDDDDENEQDKQAIETDEQLYARRMSTLRQLERGTSLHRRAHSTGDMMVPPTEAFIEPITHLTDNNIEQWRMTVMEADNMSHSTPRSSEYVPSPMTEEEEEEEEEDDLLEEPIARSKNNTMMKQPMPTNTNRRSTLGELDMFYYQQQQQQQQQQMYNMQMQQALQMQQAQQMVQIQQYQQAMQMQQQQMYPMYPQHSDKSNNRKSVSAMDLMMQLEQEKAASRKSNKKKMPDPSKANLNEGLLSHVPKHGQHNINFQQQVRKMQQMPRASISDYQLQQMQQKSSRPSSSMMRHPMVRSDSSPMPTLSMSTPLNQQQGYFIPQQPMMLAPTMNMRSSQHLPSKRQSSHMNNKF